MIESGGRRTDGRTDGRDGIIIKESEEEGRVLSLDGLLIGLVIECVSFAPMSGCDQSTKIDQTFDQTFEVCRVHISLPSIDGCSK